MAVCVYCGDELEWHPIMGWIHLGEGIYKVRCGQCGWYGGETPSPSRCPECGGRDIRDDHAACPSMDGQSVRRAYGSGDRTVTDLSRAGLAPPLLKENSDRV